MGRELIGVTRGDAQIGNTENNVQTLSNSLVARAHPCLSASVDLGSMDAGRSEESPVASIFLLTP